MKRIHFVATGIALVFVVQAVAQKHAVEHKLDFERYESYFEKNDSGLKGRISYLGFTSQAQFDKVFHPARTTGQNSFLPENTFETKLVIATVKRGRSLRTYDHMKVTVKNGNLYVWYRARDSDASSDETFNSPLILAVNKGHYSQIIFMQNGKMARAIWLPKTK